MARAPCDSTLVVDGLESAPFSLTIRLRGQWGARSWCIGIRIHVEHVCAPLHIAVDAQISSFGGRNGDIWLMYRVGSPLPPAIIPPTHQPFWPMDRTFPLRAVNHDTIFPRSQAGRLNSRGSRWLSAMGAGCSLCEAQVIWCAAIPYSKSVRSGTGLRHPAIFDAPGRRWFMRSLVVAAGKG